MPDFEIGDLVTIVAGSEYDGTSTLSNPPHGQTGRVTDNDTPFEDTHTLTVRWEHSGIDNVYRPEDLEHIVAKKQKSSRPSFRNWMMKLDGKEEEDTWSVPFYEKPRSLLDRWDELLSSYSEHGRIISDRYIMYGFTWTTDPNEDSEDSWADTHDYLTLTDSQRARLDSWCEQEGYAVPC